MYFFGPRDIRFHLKKYLFKNSHIVENKTIIDIPAGTGITTSLLKDLGANVMAFDLLPEQFMLQGITCQYADMTKNLPIEDSVADCVICQEGIEHIPNQLLAFHELNRITKPNGALLLTTPNYSKLKSKISYLLFETETINRTMPPNEFDSIWMNSDQNQTDIYYGHIFLTGIQKLRVLAKLSGFRIKKIIPTRVRYSSLVYFLPLYPFIVLTSLITYFRSVNKLNGVYKSAKKKVYREQLRLNLNPVVLLDSFLFVEFEKEHELSGVKQQIAQYKADKP